MRYPMITGHTGNDGTPANSIESIEKSISLGADAFEVDIRKDDHSELVLSHDARSQSDYDHCPRLTEALKIVSRHPGIRINCDLKDSGLPLLVIAHALSMGVGQDQLILTGFITPSYLSKYGDIVKMADIYLNAECIFEDFYFKRFCQAEAERQLSEFHENPWKYIKKNIPSIDPYIGTLSDTCLKCGAKGINIPYIFLTSQNIKRFRNNGVALSAWTVDSKPEMERLLAWNIENLTTRRVDKAKMVRKRLLGF